MLALLFSGILFKDEVFHDLALVRLRDEFGEILFESDPMPWDFSKYYSEEIGSPITRRFVFFNKPFRQDLLADAKNATRKIEKELSRDYGNRNVNLDPGYLTLAKVVLATKKDHAHRIYLRDGVFADMTLNYWTGAGYLPNPKTYRDYGSKEYIEIFNRARDYFKENEQLFGKTPWEPKE